MRKDYRISLSALAGGLLFFCGVLMRFSARSLSWPKAYVFFGDRESTVWAFREHAFTDVSLALLFLGTGILLLAFHRWLNR